MPESISQMPSNPACAARVLAMPSRPFPHQRSPDRVVESARQAEPDRELPQDSTTPCPDLNAFARCDAIDALAILGETYGFELVYSWLVTLAWRYGVDLPRPQA